LAHKRRTQAEAHKRVEEAQEALAAAQQILEDASSECAARTRELQTLERDLADLPVEPHSSRAAGIELPAELEEDEEAAQAIAKADAAAHEARAFLAGKLRAKQTQREAARVEATDNAARATCVAERDGDDGHMELDEEDVDELVSMVEQPDAATNGAGASADGESVAKRAELKRRITAVANGIVRKKLKGRKCS
jgi:chromosome segregation ATPase